MRKLSENAGLSQVYTNHCIRATVITNLDNAGFKARHIRAVSSHKSDETIKSYAVCCPEVKKKEMSDALSTKLKKKKELVEPVATTSKAQNEYSTINFEDIVDYIPIENNADDFNIGTIIAEVNNPKGPICSENAVTPANPQQSAMQILKENIQVPTPIEMPNPINTSNSINVTQANNFPLIPQMYFPNSNVTINYNITPK